MLNRSITLLAAALVVAAAPALSAQTSVALSQRSRPVYDAVTIGGAFGGLGAISVHQLGSDSTWSKFAGNYGVGFEYRFRHVGVRAEGRDFVYKFDRYGFDKTQHDIAWQGGLTLSF